MSKLRSNKVSEHTPTPWKLAAYESFGQAVLAITDRTGGEIVHNTDSVKNAEFIVRAVNAHEDLLQALRHLLFVSCQGFDKFPVETVQNAWIKASEAIYKAEGSANASREGK